MAESSPVSVDRFKGSHALTYKKIASTIDSPMRLLSLFALVAASLSSACGGATRATSSPAETTNASVVTAQSAPVVVDLSPPPAPSAAASAEPSPAPAGKTDEEEVDEASERADMQEAIDREEAEKRGRLIAEAPGMMAPLGEGGVGMGGLGLSASGTTGAAQGVGLGFGGRGNSPRPPPPQVRMGPLTVKGGLPPEIIMRVNRSNFNRLRLCYENGLRKNPSLGGQVSVRFTIGPNGNVTRSEKASADIPDAAVTSCVVRTFLSIKYPQPSPSGVVVVVAPITFVPPAPVTGTATAPPPPPPPATKP